MRFTQEEISSIRQFSSYEALVTSLIASNQNAKNIVEAEYTENFLRKLREIDQKQFEAIKNSNQYLYFDLEREH